MGAGVSIWDISFRCGFAKGFCTSRLLLRGSPEDAQSKAMPRHVPHRAGLFLELQQSFWGYLQFLSLSSGVVRMGQCLCPLKPTSLSARGLTTRLG